ncbi:MAG: FAD-dependent oxidoreductase, partial [Hyphomonadaceae bacterium]|nr:FAD-dependent oxidoreductase [Hyphomonadaceae bacterium]
TAEGKPVQIGRLQRYATDVAMGQGKQFYTRAPSTGKKVAVVGAGPAGLAAAHRLATKGHDVTIFEAKPKSGGLNEYGIAAYKSVDGFAQAEVDYVTAIGGITIEHGRALGRDVHLSDLTSMYDAVFLGMGLPGVNALRAEGEDAAGVDNAVEFIADLRQAEDLAGVPVGRRVVVIGGGDTAMDCVRTARRQGAKSVTCLYRRDRANMPGSQREVGYAEEEGVAFDFLAAPKSVRAGKQPGVKAVRMHLGAPDASGRQSPEETPDSEFTVPGDLIIAALGFDPEDLQEDWDAPELKVSRWGTLTVDPAFATSLPGVYAAGDIVRGASLVVWAIKEGRDAADSIHAFLKDRAHTARVAAE